MSITGIIFAVIIIMDQYREHLASNVEAILDAEKKYLSQFRDE